MLLGGVAVGGAVIALAVPAAGSQAIVGLSSGVTVAAREYLSETPNGFG
jgi:hypothetical protein